MDKKNDKKTGAVMVLGAGIAGVQASLDLANSGFKVYLVERDAAIGGMMSRLDKTFPTGDCATCMTSPKLVECARNLNVEILTLSELQNLDGEPGNFTATIKRRPRYINEDKCTACEMCIQNCPVKYEIYPGPKERTRPALSAEYLAGTRDIVDRYRATNGTLNTVLKDINAQFGYLPEDVLRYVSVELDIPLSLMYRIATFYSAFSFTPRGRHTISVCLGTTCHVRGADKILTAIERSLKVGAGQTTEDMRFTVETVRCLGCCSLAPVINVDGETYGNIKGAGVLEILEQYE